MKTLFVQPLITEKSMALTNEGIYQFVVPTWATKPHIASVISDRFGVSVEDVKTARFSGKFVNFKRKPGKQDNFKKASVHLKKGDSIADFSLPIEQEQSANPEKEPQITEPQAETKTDSKITVRSKSGKNKV